jgi:hypothetical protein
VSGGGGCYSLFIDIILVVFLSCILSTVMMVLYLLNQFFKFSFFFFQGYRDSEYHLSVSFLSFSLEFVRLCSLGRGIGGGVFPGESSQVSHNRAFPSSWQRI